MKTKYILHPLLLLISFIPLQMEVRDLHVSKGGRAGRRERDEANKVREHTQAYALGADDSWPYLGAPDEGWRVNELEEHDEQEDDSDCCAISSFVVGPKVLVL